MSHWLEHIEYLKLLAQKGDEKAIAICKQLRLKCE